MTEDKPDRALKDNNPDRPVSPPGYGGLSEGSVGDPTAPATEKRPEARRGAEPAATDKEAGERDAAPTGEQSAAIPGLLEQSQPLQLESSAEHKSSWPDEGGTGEAGTG